MALTAEEIAAKELELAKREQEFAGKEQELIDKFKAKELELQEKEQQLKKIQSTTLEDDKFKEIVKTQVDDQLKEIKDKLNKAYEARDAALKVIAEKEQKEREAEIKRLQEEGKHKEAYEMQMAEMKASMDTLAKQNIELTRDIELRGILNGCNFRNESAMEMAYKEIVGELIKTENNIWVHKSGVGVREFVKIFCERENNSFLFKQTTSSGASTTTVKTTDVTKPTSLFKMSQEDVLKLAKEGKLPNQK